MREEKTLERLDARRAVVKQRIEVKSSGTRFLALASAYVRGCTDDLQEVKDALEEHVKERVKLARMEAGND